MSIICPNCGNTNEKNAQVCSKCGKKLVDKNISSSGVANNNNQAQSDKRRNAEEIDKKLKDKYREKMHGDGGAGFNSFVDGEKKKRSSRIIRFGVSIIIIAVLAVSGKMVYDNFKNRDDSIRKVKIGMTKEEVKNTEKEGKENVLSDDILLYEDIKYAGVNADVFYNFRDDKLSYVQIKTKEYSDEDTKNKDLKKIIDELDTSYGSEVGKTKDEKKMVWEINDKLRAYLVVTDNMIEVDVSEPITSLDDEINNNK